jgi:hypothetical protein
LLDDTASPGTTARPHALDGPTAQHINEYAVDRGRLADVERRDLDAGAFNDTTLRWRVSPVELNADAALASAEELYEVIRLAASRTLRSRRTRRVGGLGDSL